MTKKGEVKMTKNELLEYTELGAELRALEEEYREARSFTDEGKSFFIKDISTSPEMDRILYKLTKLEHIYFDKWNENITKRIDIVRAINSLDDPTERTLMLYRYIKGLTWENVCRKINYSWVQTHKIHNRALDKLTKYDQ